MPFSVAAWSDQTSPTVWCDGSDAAMYPPCKRLRAATSPGLNGRRLRPKVIVFTSRPCEVEEQLCSGGAAFRDMVTRRILANRLTRSPPGKSGNRIKLRSFNSQT
jgi:hypothetical protein